MRKFEFLPHTADIRLFVIGDSYNELFIASLEGMNRILCTTNNNKSLIVNVFIEVQSLDITMLLIDFLSEVLTRSHNNKTVYSDIDIISLEEHTITANLRGFKVNEFDEDIKAVTYAEADINKDNSGLYSTNLVFDI